MTWRVPLLLGALALVLFGYWQAAGHDLFAGVDNRAYWEAWRGGALYDNEARVALPTFIYSPAVAQALYLPTLLPWDVFRAGWIALSIASVTWMVWPLALTYRLIALAMALYLCLEARSDWLIALVLATGLRWPGIMAIALLTKITPGLLGLVWFATRREWRNLAIACAVTTFVIGVSALMAPHLWVEWISVLSRSVEYQSHGQLLGAAIPPLALRFPIAVALVAVGALRGHGWTLPLGAIVAAPNIFTGTILILAAIPRIPPVAASWLVPPVQHPRRGTGGT